MVNEIYKNNELENEVNSLVKEQQAIYGKISYNDLFSNKMLLIQSIKTGISFSLFTKIQKLSPFTLEYWAEFLQISTKTLQRNQGEKDFKFKPIHSEKILEMAEVMNFGKQVFDTPEQFYEWLGTPSIALGNSKPNDLLSNSYGKDLVMNELNKIEHGIFS